MRAGCDQDTLMQQRVSPAPAARCARLGTSRGRGDRRNFPPGCPFPKQQVSRTLPPACLGSFPFFVMFQFQFHLAVSSSHEYFSSCAVDIKHTSSTKPSSRSHHLNSGLRIGAHAKSNKLAERQDTTQTFYRKNVARWECILPLFSIPAYPDDFLDRRDTEFCQNHRFLKTIFPAIPCTVQHKTLHTAKCEYKVASIGASIFSHQVKPSFSCVILIIQHFLFLKSSQNMLFTNI
jgi:hypothetical protein